MTCWASVWSKTLTQKHRKTNTSDTPAKRAAAARYCVGFPCNSTCVAKLRVAALTENLLDDGELLFSAGEFQQAEEGYVFFTKTAMPGRSE
jgi:hypothetical protein